MTVVNDNETVVFQSHNNVSNTHVIYQPFSAYAHSGDVRVMRLRILKSFVIVCLDIDWCIHSLTFHACSGAEVSTCMVYP